MEDMAARSKGEDSGLSLLQSSMLLLFHDRHVLLLIHAVVEEVHAFELLFFLVVLVQGAEADLAIRCFGLARRDIVVKGSWLDADMRLRRPDLVNRGQSWLEMLVWLLELNGAQLSCIVDRAEYLRIEPRLIPNSS